MLGIGLIMRRRRGAGEIEDLVDLHPLRAQLRRQRLDDIAFYEIETRLPLEMTKILLASCQKAVDGSDVSAFAQESVT